MRKLTLTGRLGADAQIRKTQNGTNYVTFSVASEEYGDNGVTWVSVTSWNERDVNRAKWFTKGRPVELLGDMSLSEYTDRNGQKQVSVNVRADYISWINDGKREDTNGQSETQTQSSNAQPQSSNAQPEIPKMVEPKQQKAPQVDSTYTDDLPF